MKVVNVDKNGNSLWEDAEKRLASLKTELQPYLQMIKQRIQDNEKKQYPQKLNFSYSLSNKIAIITSKYSKIPCKYAVDVDIETLKQYINCFYRLLDFILSYYEDFLVTKPLFCQFMGIDTFTYGQLLLCKDIDILTEMRMLDETLLNASLLSAQEGRFKERTTETRMRMDGVGHSVVIKPKADEQTQTINFISYDTNAVTEKLKNLGIKLIENNDK